MSPQASAFLDKAQKLLVQADIMLNVGLNETAGRTAYLAGFHAVQAFLFEKLKRVFKTHNGVQTEFLRLTMDDQRIDNALRTFLPRMYNLKTVADYETGPGAEVSAERAAEAVELAKQFVLRIAAFLSPAA